MFRTRVPFALLCALAAVAFAGPMGCGGDPDPAESCAIFCDRNVECQKDSPGKDVCLASCNDLAQKESYAEALANQSECYEIATCEEINSGGCDPQDL